MSDTLSRRDFLKLATLGSAAAAALTGCGTAARYVKRQPYSDMPEYTLPGQSTFYATTCQDCAAGCGLIVRTVEGRALKVEGNPNHPVSRGRTCARAQAALQGLYNPDRVIGPQMQAQRGSGAFGPINWETAITVVKDALQKTPPAEIAFLTGLAPDHVFDLVSELTAALGAPPPLRYGALGMFEARHTLAQAAAAVFGTPGLPVFDLAGAQVVFSFGANFAETWLSPVAYQRAFGEMRQTQDPLHSRGYLVQFEARMSLTAASADEWVPVTPGSEGILAQAFARLLVDPAADIAAAAQAAGVSEERLLRLAGIFARAERKLALPGGAALAQSNGLETAQAILALNVLAGNLGQPGGVQFWLAPAVGQDGGAASFGEIKDLVDRMNKGQVKTLFIHGVNPLFELPQALGFAQALENVSQVISFASFFNETAAQSNYLLPDHTPFEAWGYQRTSSGGEQGTLSSIQPVVTPLYDTKSSVDVLLAAFQLLGDETAPRLPYRDEVAYLQQAVAKLVQQGASFTSNDPALFWTQWLQQGGWWSSAAAAVNGAVPPGLTVPPPEYHGAGEFYLLPFPHPHLGDGAGANRPWLQETPDPMTTVMWDSWVEINPQTADRLGLKDDDVVQVVSPVGSVNAVVYRYPAIRPDTVAIPFGQGHTELGRYAQGRGANPLDLLSLRRNAAGDLAFAAVKVDLRPTGLTRKLARFEDRVGVYGDGKK